MEETSVAKTIFMESPEATETYAAGFAGTLNNVNEIEDEFQARSVATTSNAFAPQDNDACFDQLPVPFASAPPTRTEATPFASSAVPARAADAQTTETPSSWEFNFKTGATESRTTLVAYFGLRLPQASLSVREKGFFPSHSESVTATTEAAFQDTEPVTLSVNPVPESVKVEGSDAETST